MLLRNQGRYQTALARTQQKYFSGVDNVKVLDFCKHNLKIFHFGEDRHLFCCPACALAFGTSTTEIKAICSIAFRGKVLSVWGHGCVSQGRTVGQHDNRQRTFLSFRRVQLAIDVDVPGYAVHFLDYAFVNCLSILFIGVFRSVRVCFRTRWHCNHQNCAADNRCKLSNDIIHNMDKNVKPFHACLR